MAGKKHIHRYHKVNTGAGEIWACGFPECQHFMPAHFTKLILGKASICWGCGDTLILTRENMLSAQPICGVCLGEAELVTAAVNARMEKQPSLDLQEPEDDNNL